LLDWGLALSDYRRFWVGLNMVKGIGAVRLRSLLDAFGDAQSAWQAHPEELRAAGLPAGIVENLIKLRASVVLEAIWDQIEAQGIQVIIWDDEQYPVRLREIDQAPPVLYVRGILDLQDEWAVAIVGTRRITAYGRQVAERIAVKLANSGITVVSGLALGVDTVAHQVTLHVGCWRAHAGGIRLWRRSSLPATQSTIGRTHSGKWCTIERLCPRNTSRSE